VGRLSVGEQLLGEEGLGALPVPLPTRHLVPYSCTLGSVRGSAGCLGGCHLLLVVGVVVGVGPLAVAPSSVAGPLTVVTLLGGPVLGLGL
jgi:hypothetical protein